MPEKYTDEEAGLNLLTDTWNYFWKYCPDPESYYEFYITDDAQLDRAFDVAYRILAQEHQ